MTILLQLRNATKGFGDQVLMDDTGLELTDHDNVALIGRNGAGKSTLCRVLLGEEELDGGELARHPSLRLGYLHQHDPFEPGEAVLDFLMRESGQPDWRCGAVGGRFELKGRLLEGPVSELSGGWQTRVKLTALLLQEPNLLILDEPTNFLDLRTQMLLEQFLRDFPGGCLVVSHDRDFLRATCRHTIELARGKLTRFAGGVDAYLEQQRQRREHDRRVNATIEAKAQQLQTFIDKNRAGANTASRAKAKETQLERLLEQRVEIEADEANVTMHVPDVEPRRGAAVRCDDLAIGYEAFRVADDINLEIDHGTRVGVVGDNGEGKTTFLRTITESLPPLDGEVRWGHGCDVGTYAQHVYAALPETWTVLEYLRACATTAVGDTVLRNAAGSFLFRGDDVFKQIEVLSGGERARLCLAGLLLGRFNVLVLDEPANHLDVETVEVLADALRRYRGTVIFTSHERHFMRRVASSVLEVRGGRVRNFRGEYDAYVEHVQNEISAGLRDSGAAAAKPNKTTRVNRDKEAARRQHERRRELASVERRLEKLTSQAEALDAQLLQCTDADEAQTVYEQQQGVRAELSDVEERWLVLQEELE